MNNASSLTNLIPPPEPAPYVSTPEKVTLTNQEIVILQWIYRGFKEIIVEEELSGGYSGVHVVLTVPVGLDGHNAARRVVKLGYAPELRNERDRYTEFVEPHLPMRVTRVETERYYEQDDWAGLPYIFVDDDTFGDKAMDLDAYYRQAFPGNVELVVSTLDNLLRQKLGESWYKKTDKRTRPFAAEYSRCLVEYLRLQLRPASSDHFWPISQPPAANTDYLKLSADAVPHEYQAKQPGALLSIEGLRVTQIRRGAAILEDINGKGMVIVVEFMPGTVTAQGLSLGQPLGVCGQVVFNRHDRMQEIARVLFPDLPDGVENKSIQLPCSAGLDGPPVYPNPLWLYPEVLGKVLLEGGLSYTHGDLHLHNVLVDMSGQPWPIDFARVQKRHTLFDFITLETRIRMTELSRADCTFSLCDYTRFEEAVNDATLGLEATPPDDPHLRFAYQVILAIRETARKYTDSFEKEYFPALFLYCLGVTRYYPDEGEQGGRLAFATACVLAANLSEDHRPIWPTGAELNHRTKDAIRQPAASKQGQHISHSVVGDSGTQVQGARVKEGRVKIGGNVESSTIIVGSDVNTGGGDFVGHDKFSIQHRNTGLSAADVQQLFEALYAAVEARPNTSQETKADLNAELQEVQTEVAKEDKADETFLVRHLRNIGRMAPDILEVVLATLEKPAAGLGAVVRKVTEKMKAETKK